MKWKNIKKEINKQIIGLTILVSSIILFLAIYFYGIFRIWNGYSFFPF